MNEYKVHIFVTIHFYIRKNTPGNSLQQFNTHDHVGSLLSLSGNPQILANTAYLAHIKIGSLSGNKMSLYMDEMISEFNCSTYTLVKYFA